jgi:4-hydroxybenzoate polyprenyltransferase
VAERMKEIFRLIRIGQWYKNLVIFIPLIFAKYTEISGILLTLAGFIALCLISSANYTINDIIDRDADRKNPEKKSRPVASGKISVALAWLITAVTGLCAFAISAYISNSFFIAVAALFVLTLAYSLFLKNEAFADIIAISGNFVIRIVSGVFITNVRLSPWLIMCPFFLALFLAAGKREAEVKSLGKNALLHRKNLSAYTPSLTKALTGISATMLMISYSLYCFLSIYPQLMFTIPFALYILFRYLYLIDSGSEVARRPEKIFSDKRITITGIIMAALVFALIYLI